MNNKVKLVLALLAGGTALLLNQRRKKLSQKVKTFTAPDGTIYNENQIYRNAEGKAYRNGKVVHFDHLEFENDHSANSFNHQHDDKFSKNYQAKPQNVDYHQRGKRHR
ncbi:hypothetical protein CHRY9390_00232 [Chryseobacterium aquaeductus]|uniref:Uncharacterized protein n=1 Tax=Chryseobacterium aquaeductus TaxID=2675056 RepID=A0A9N8QT53_9FLAO|nr:hypothetical protein [Chryseobacterium aquaeductus]CAA7329593.1 hypothetical protein CHRY9390_00232 [Chryseobacterium potabilaquae]CAD7797814.1 hypothetical protein CHRY9390_00232 [Chryseobacterium aquaeductus]